MRFCAHCGVKLANDNPKCPLCDMDTEKIDDEFSLDYPYIKSRFTRGLLIRLISFMAVVFASASFMIDHLVPTGSPWALITIAAIVYVWISAMNLLRHTPNPASIALCQLFCIGGLVFFIDFFTGFYRWSVNFVIHFLIIGSAIATTLMIAIRPMKYRAFTIYQFVIAALGVLSVLLWVFGWSEIEWPVVTAAGVSILCFLAMLVFSYRRTQHELKKRFHV